MTIPGWAWVWWHRAANRYFDLRAVIAGYCNHRPWSPIPGEGGGYAHWRCALKRHHEGLHRARNYVWSNDGKTSYLPVPIGIREPDQPWERTMTPTRRQKRISDAWMAERLGTMRQKRGSRAR